jgi:hypothetical protein
MIGGTENLERGLQVPVADKNRGAISDGESERLKEKAPA